MENFLDALTRNSTAAAWLGIFVLIVVWAVCDMIGDIFKNKNKK